MENNQINNTTIEDCIIQDGGNDMDVVIDKEFSDLTLKIEELPLQWKPVDDQLSLEATLPFEQTTLGVEIQTIEAIVTSIQAEIESYKNIPRSDEDKKKRGEKHETKELEETVAQYFIKIEDAKQEKTRYDNIRKEEIERANLLLDSYEKTNQKLGDFIDKVLNKNKENKTLLKYKH